MVNTQATIYTVPEGRNLAVEQIAPTSLSEQELDRRAKAASSLMHSGKDGRNMQQPTGLPSVLEEMRNLDETGAYLLAYDASSPEAFPGKVEGVLRTVPRGSRSDPKIPVGIDLHLGYRWRHVHTSRVGGALLHAALMGVEPERAVVAYEPDGLTAELYEGLGCVGKRPHHMSSEYQLTVPVSVFRSIAGRVMEQLVSIHPWLPEGQRAS